MQTKLLTGHIVGTDLRKYIKNFDGILIVRTQKFPIRPTRFIRIMKWVILVMHKIRDEMQLYMNKLG